MNIQDFVNAIGDAGERERGNYHLTFGQLIDALKNAKETDRITPTITGIGAYRGYYSDMALMTETVGTEPMYIKDMWKDLDAPSEDYEASKFSIEKL